MTRATAKGRAALPPLERGGGGDGSAVLFAAVPAGNVGLWSWDVGTGEVPYSREWKAQLGYGDEEVGASLEEWRSRVHPDDLPAAEARVCASLEAPRPDYENRFRTRHRDGSYRHTLAQASAETDAEGRVVRMIGSNIDLIEVEQAREAERIAAAERDVALRWLVRILLENLLSNAWKFTSRKGEARIDVGAERVAEPPSGSGLRAEWEP